MGNENEFKENSQAVQAHLGITQSVIQRMAANSASCKTWCITLVSAILVIVADKGKPQYAFIALIPNAFFSCFGHLLPCARTNVQTILQPFYRKIARWQNSGC